LAASPCTPFRFFKGKEIFRVAAREVTSAPRGTYSITTRPNAYAKVQSHHALRALQINRFAIGRKFELRSIAPHNFELPVLKAPYGAAAKLPRCEEKPVA
jgi:hypothetical protein